MSAPAQTPGDGSPGASPDSLPSPPDPDRLPGWAPARPVSVGPLSLAVHANDPAVRARFDQLLAAFPDAPPRSADRADGDPWRGPYDGGPVELRVSSFDWVQRGERWVRGYHLFVGSEPRVLTTIPSECEDLILSNLNRWLLQAQPDLVHLHAGLISVEGRGVVLVGPSGSGKSTLTCHAVRRGWTYHTDEMLAVDPADGTVHSYPRPPSLKRGSWPLFADLPSVPDPDRTPAWIDRTHLPPAELGAASASGPETIVAVAFVDHRGDPGIRPVGVPAAVERLAADTLDLERTGIAGMTTLVRLASTTRCVALGSSDLDAAVAELTGLRRSGPPSASPSEADDVLPGGRGDPARTPSPGDRLSRAPSACAWRVPGGAVVYDLAQGTIARLDEPGAVVWALLADEPSVDDVVEAVTGATGAPTDDVAAGIGAFVDRLSGAGLVGPVTLERLARP